MEIIVLVIGILFLALIITSKVSDIVIGALITIGGFLFNSYLNTLEGYALKIELLFEYGITGVESYVNIVIAVGVVLMVIGVVRCLTSKNKVKNAPPVPPAQ